MIDLHTHLLPGWDDGAKDWESAHEMAEVAYRDGISKIVLTPHIFRGNRHNDDALALGECMGQFQDRAKDWPIAFFRGAEVFIHHEITGNLKEWNLTVNGSNYVFLEFPSDHILPNVKEIFFNLMLSGYIPIISHPERNHVLREKPHLFYELIRMGSLGQVTARSLIGGFGRTVQKTAHLFLENNLVHVIASDAHDSIHRPPQLSEAVQIARRLIGEAKATAMVTTIPQAILDNDDIGDWGDPVSPGREKKWIVKFPKLPGQRKSHGE
jgi:protein-tyrosine phosphatase